VPWFKNVYSALLVCLPLLYGSLIAGVSVPLAYYFVPGQFVLGRESLIDAHQADDGRQAGFRTLPILLGRRATEVCGTVVVMIAGVLLTYLAPGTTARLVAGLCVAAIAAVLAMPLPAIRRTGLLRIPMAIGVVAIGLSLSLHQLLKNSLRQTSALQCMFEPCSGRGIFCAAYDCEHSKIRRTDSWRRSSRTHVCD
jgi:4-hydroxybenzoate polyprenyltransferase